MINNIFKIALTDIEKNRRKLSVSSQDFKKKKNENSINHARISNEIQNFNNSSSTLKQKNKHIFEI